MKRRRGAAWATIGLILAAMIFSGWNVADGYRRGRSLVAQDLAAHPPELSPDRLPADYLRILLTVEDPGFYSHRGVDLHTPGAGLTTITQGLVKFLFFERFQPGLDKIRQSLIALGFDRRVGKKMQLQVFLNRVYLGTRPDGSEVHGFPGAARTYFGKEVAALSRDEWIALVAMVIGPDQYSVATAPEANADRAGRIRKLLSGACRPSGLRDVTYEACR